MEFPSCSRLNTTKFYLLVVSVSISKLTAQSGCEIIAVVRYDHCTRRYKHLSPSDNRNYTVLYIVGRGHFIALVMDRAGDMEGDAVAYRK